MSLVSGLNGTFGSLVEQLSGLFAAGGPVVGVLGLLSLVAVTIVLLKLWQFARLRLNDRAPITTALTLWYRQQPAAAIAAVTDRPQPAARLLLVAFSALQEGEYGADGRPGAGPDHLSPAASRRLAVREELREELTRMASAQLEQLRGYLRALEIIGSLSPLLGLLGTVLGMIEAFRQLEIAGSQVDPAILSGGIWQALLTTAVGLIVAIPTVLAHGWLERRVDRCGHEMEDAVTRVFTRRVASAVPAAAGSGQAVHQAGPPVRGDAGPTLEPAVVSASAASGYAA
ncbi:MAG: MotA/TolQ/ExbB proton channel family protein [Chromatiaceae bacterium]|nr:MAG: MotA/TolQ/ExbB proton channel family protein [Chromatiaceae bacterium]